MNAARAPLMSIARQSARSLVQQHQLRGGAVSSSRAVAAAAAASTGQRRLLAGAVTGWNVSALAVLSGKTPMASYPPAWSSINANLPSNRSFGAAAPNQDEEEDNTAVASSSSRGHTSCEVTGEDADEPVGVARALEDTARKKTYENDAPVIVLNARWLDADDEQLKDQFLESPADQESTRQIAQEDCSAAEEFVEVEFAESWMEFSDFPDSP